jgi:DNA gyrase subunit A
VMLISTGGVLIRTQVKSIREMSRSTQGVTLINLGPGEKLAGLERVVDTDDDTAVNGDIPDSGDGVDTAANDDAGSDEV